MRPEPVKRKKKFHMGKGRRYQILAWSVVVGMVALLGGGTTFAWYTLKEREAETKTATVMKPYYLELRNADETEIKQLSIGGLLQGQVKQVVFCVSSEEAQQKNPDTAIFNYALELVYTDNLDLQYEIYPLEEVVINTDGGTEGNIGGSTENLIITEYVENAGEATEKTKYKYWQKSGAALSGTDVSEIRWEQAGLLEEDAVAGDGTTTGDETTDDTGEIAGEGSTTIADVNAATQYIINRGTYISYEIQVDENGVTSDDNNLELTAGADTTQYFVLEIKGDFEGGYEKYVKETEMIYLLAKALQPQPK